MSSAFETLATVSFCRQLPSPLIQQLADMCWTIRKTSGSNIQYLGEPVYAVYVVAEGRVRISRSAANGRDLVLALSGRGTCLNLGALLDNGPCSKTADAAGDTTLLMLPTVELREVFEREPLLMRAIALELADHERTLLDLLESITLRSLPARLAGLLLSDAARSSNNHEIAPHTQEELAARLGTVREMIGRTLRQFTDRGLIRIEARRIIIVNHEGLQRERDG